MPSIRKSARDKYYRIVYYQDGHQRSISCRTNNKAEAQAQLREFTRQYNQKKNDTPLNRPPDSRISGLLNTYFTLRQLSPSAQRMYRLSVTHWIRINGDLHPSRYTIIHAAAFLEYLRNLQYRNHPISDATISTYIRHIRSLFSWFVKQKWVRENHIATYKTPPGKPVRIPPEHLELLISNAPPPLANLIRFLSLTALRINEALSLRWSNIDLSQRTITLFNQKARRTDTIPLIDPVHTLLLSMEPLPGNRIFAYSNYEAAKSAWRRLLHKTGLHYKIHSLRSTCASNLARLNIPPDTLQKYIRHKNIATTMQYYVANDTETMAREINIALASITLLTKNDT